MEKAGVKEDGGAENFAGAEDRFYECEYGTVRSDTCISTLHHLGLHELMESEWSLPYTFFDMVLARSSQYKTMVPHILFPICSTGVGMRIVGNSFIFSQTGFA